MERITLLAPRLVRVALQVPRRLSPTQAIRQVIHLLDTCLSLAFGMAPGPRRSGRRSVPINVIIGLGTRLVSKAVQLRPTSRQSVTRSALAARLVQWLRLGRRLGLVTLLWVRCCGM